MLPLWDVLFLIFPQYWFLSNHGGKGIIHGVVPVQKSMIKSIKTHAFAANAVFTTGEPRGAVDGSVFIYTKSLNFAEWSKSSDNLI